MARIGSGETHTDPTDLRVHIYKAEPHHLCLSVRFDHPKWAFEVQVHAMVASRGGSYMDNDLRRAAQRVSFFRPSDDLVIDKGRDGLGAILPAGLEPSL